MNTLEQSLLTALFFFSPQSIAELSSSIGKSVPNVTRSIGYLLGNDLIVENGLAPSTGGRRALQYSLNSEALPAILAIAIDQYRTVVELVNLSNRSLKIKEGIVLDLKQEDRPQEKIIALIESYLADLFGHRILAIGISMPGFVNTELGFNTSYPEHHPLYNLKDAIQEHFQIPCYIENDSTVIAIAEHKFGKAKGVNNALVVNLNWGVGLGMILGGELFKGSSGFAGEFSHIPLSDLKKLCSCGKRGCLEVEASLVAAIENANQRLQNGEISQLSEAFRFNKGVTIDELMNAALQGDQVALESFARIGYMLGKGIATLIHVINPEKVIISGKGAELGQILLHQIQSSILEFSIQKLSKITSVEISDLKNAQITGTVATAVSAMNWKTINTKLINTLN